MSDCIQSTVLLRCNFTLAKATHAQKQHTRVRVKFMRVIKPSPSSQILQAEGIHSKTYLTW